MPPADFLDLPARSRKPRTVGLTHVLDKGLPIEHVRALLRQCASYVDIWKFGWGVAYIEDAVAEKVALLREWQVLACPGGTLLELAWAQGRSADFLAWAAACGFPCVEVSNGTVGMPAAAKRALVEAAAGRFRVLSEVGSKDPNVPVSTSQWSEQARADVSVGAEWVITEGRESGSVGLYESNGQVRGELVFALIDAVGAERLIFEAPRREQQVWLLRSLGHEVSLGNIAPAEVVGVETLRLGLRADTFSPVAGRAAEGRSG